VQVIGKRKTHESMERAEYHTGGRRGGQLKKKGFHDVMNSVSRDSKLMVALDKKNQLNGVATPGARPSSYWEGGKIGGKRAESPAVRAAKNS